MKRLILFFFLVAGMYGHPLKTAGQQIPVMQEEINDIKQEIKELEEEIREVEKTDPEEAKMLKSQLSTMRSMLEMLDKTAKPASRTQSSPLAAGAGKNALSPAPAVRSPLVPVVLKQPVPIPPPSQINDKLLWYKGKKINDSTLITGRGMVVQYSQKRNLVKLQPDKKSDPFDKIVREIEKNEQRKEELVEIFDQLPNGFLYYPQLKQGLDKSDDLAEIFGDLVKNTIELPPLPDFSSSGNVFTPAGRGPNAGFQLNSWQVDEEVSENIQNFVTQQLEKAKMLYNSLPPVAEFPAPPAHDFGLCISCDSRKQKEQERQDSLWNDKYSGKEREIMQYLSSAERAAAQMGAASAVNDTIGIFGSLGNLVMQRMDAKNKLLQSRYGKDVRTIPVVARIILGFERQKQLLGMVEEDQVFSFSDLVSDLPAGYEKYFDEQAELKNHDFVLNLAAHIGLARQMALLGLEDEGNAFFGKMLQKSIRYNRFGLTAEIDFIYEQRNSGEELAFKATGKLETSVKQFVMLYPTGCRFKVQPYNKDFQKVDLKDITIPFTVISGVKTQREEDDKLVNYPYTGPGEFPLLFPDFSIDFCDSAKPDSAWFLAFTGNEDAMAMAQSGMEHLNKSYKTDMIPFANFVFFQDEQIEENEEAMNNLGMDMMKAVVAFQAQSPAATKLGRMKQSYEGKMQMDDYRKSMQGMMTSKKSLLLYTANNRSTVLIDKYNDSKRELEEGINLTRGMLHLRVVHQPVTDQ